MLLEVENSFDLLQRNGYVHSNKPFRRFLYYHQQMITEFDIIKFGLSTTSGRKHSSISLLGEIYPIYYYLKSRRWEFENFLQREFLTLNPFPSREIRAVMTKNLHAVNLHWDFCTHNRIRGKPYSHETTSMPLRLIERNLP